MSLIPFHMQQGRQFWWTLLKGTCATLLVMAGFALAMGVLAGTAHRLFH